MLSANPKPEVRVINGVRWLFYANEPRAYQTKGIWYLPNGAFLYEKNASKYPEQRSLESVLRQVQRREKTSRTEDYTSALRQTLQVTHQALMLSDNAISTNGSVSNNAIATTGSVANNAVSTTAGVANNAMSLMASTRQGQAGAPGNQGTAINNTSSSLQAQFRLSMDLQAITDGNPDRYYSAWCAAKNNAAEAFNEAVSDLEPFLVAGSPVLSCMHEGGNMQIATINSAISSFNKAVSLLEPFLVNGSPVTPNGHHLRRVFDEKETWMSTFVMLTLVQQQIYQQKERRQQEVEESRQRVQQQDEQRRQQVATTLQQQEGKIDHYKQRIRELERRVRIYREQEVQHKKEVELKQQHLHHQREHELKQRNQELKQRNQELMQTQAEIIQQRNAEADGLRDRISKLEHLQTESNVLHRQEVEQLQRRLDNQRAWEHDALQTQANVHEGPSQNRVHYWPHSPYGAPSSSHNHFGARPTAEGPHLDRPLVPDVAYRATSPSMAGSQPNPPRNNTPRTRLGSSLLGAMGSVVGSAVGVFFSPRRNTNDPLPDPALEVSQMPNGTNGNLRVQPESGVSEVPQSTRENVNGTSSTATAQPSPSAGFQSSHGIGSAPRGSVASYPTQVASPSGTPRGAQSPYEGGRVCPICQCHFNVSSGNCAKFNGCPHKIHKQCFQQMQQNGQNECPVCRLHVTTIVGLTIDVLGSAGVVATPPSQSEGRNQNRKHTLNEDDASAQSTSDAFSQSSPTESRNKRSRHA